MVARKILATSDKKGRIVFAGSRLGDVSTRLRGLLAASHRSQSTRVVVEECLTQLNAIGDRRDRFVHRLVQYNAGKLKVSNIFTAKSILSIEEEEFTISDLTAMKNDCQKIFGKLNRVRDPSMKKNDSPAIRKFLRSPWQYKRPAPKPIDQAVDIRKNAQSPKRHPPSSGAPAR